MACHGDYCLAVQNITATSATLYYHNAEAGDSNPYAYTIYASNGTTVIATGTTSTVAPGGDGSLDTVTGLTPNTTYIAKLDQYPDTAETFSTLTDNPKVALESQWADLANRIKNAEGPTVVQTIGTSNTDVMSQDATTRMIYNGGDTKKVQIGVNAAASHNWDVAIFGGTRQECSIAIGYNTHAEANGAVALGAGSSTSTQGVFEIGLSGASSTFQGNNGYNGSAYRLLSGLYDPQSAHDAATKGYVDSVSPTITMTATDPGEGSALASNHYVGVYGGDPIIMDYSTSEINTGAKWIDGSAIYKKTVNTGALPNGSSTTTAHNISNLANVIKIEGWAKNSTTFIFLPHVSTASAGNSININIDATNIIIGTGTDQTSFTTSYVTLYYTKSS